jgi:hypothetical protein
MPLLRTICLVTLVGLASAAELTVGSGKMYAKPSLAAAAANDGDTISIDAGTYTDVCSWTRNNLTLRGVGGVALIKSGGASAGNKGNWVISGDHATVDGIEFSGGVSSDMNGAGIRCEGTGLTVRNCFFHDNQDGILANADASSDILIEKCEFAANGAGDGLSHNLYIGAVRSLTFRWNYSHHAKAGHNFKSRAQANYLIGNRIMDEGTGTSSYVVDLPNGGLTYLLGNLIQQGPLSSNRSVIVNYAEEGAVNASQHLYVCNNTIVNDYTGTGGTNFLNIAATTTVARVENNIFLGAGTAIAGPVTSNLRNLRTTTSPLVDRAGYDYHLASTATAAIDAAADPGSYEGQALLPTSQYVHPHGSQARTTSGAAPDIGAYEYAAGNAAPVIASASATPATVSGTTTALACTASDDGGAGGLAYTWSATGPASVAFSPNGTNAAKASVATFARAGAYVITATVRDAGGLTAVRTVNVTVTATPTALAVSPTNRSVVVGGVAGFSASVSDQFGQLLSPQPVVGWAVSGGGSINTAGSFTAGTTAGGPWTVTASSGTLRGTAQVTVTAANAAPVIASASAAPATVSATTTALTCSASDDGGAANLSYAWSATGPAAVAFSPNGTNAAKASTATFTRAGAYVITVIVRDAGSLTAARTVNVTVTATPTALAVSPTTRAVVVGTAAGFSAGVRDQFGQLLSPQPVVGWAVSGGGSINTAGSFTAGTTVGGPWTVTATSGALSGVAQVTVTASGGSGGSSPGGGSSASGGGGSCGAGSIALLLALLPLCCLGGGRRRTSERRA